MIEELQMINYVLIEKNKNNPELLKKYELIKKILDTKDPFMNMPIEYAYSILRDLGVKEEDLQKVYLDLLK